jgi:hypothetical protein
LPTEVGKLTTGTLIAAYRNAFDGTLPTELGTMAALKSLCARAAGDSG